MPGWMTIRTLDGMCAATVGHLTTNKAHGAIVVVLYWSCHGLFALKKACKYKVKPQSTKR